MRFLFVKTSLKWPRASGHDVYTFQFMKALSQLGHEVSLATAVAPEPQAIEGLTLQERIRLSAPLADEPTALPGTWLQHKFRSFWGVEDHWVSSLQQAVRRLKPDAAIVIGLDGLPYIPPLSGVTKVWFPADEWVWHHLSQVRLSKPSTWHSLKPAAIKGVYERAHAKAVDRVWVVTEQDRQAMHRYAGMKAVDVVPLGVDSDFFRPAVAAPQPRTAVFWGRLDFGPNVQALEWFARHIWPLVIAEAPDARMTIVGFNPVPEVDRLKAVPGISIRPNVPDLRDVARQHAAVVLPLVSGGGMKNKLLEAAAMGLPIVCTTLATQGLNGLNDGPLLVADTPNAFARALLDLWQDEERRRRIAAETRAWVVTHHSWEAAGKIAAATLNGGPTSHA